MTDSNERYQPRGKPRTLSSAASGGVVNPKGNKDQVWGFHLDETIYSLSGPPCPKWASSWEQQNWQKLGVVMWDARYYGDSQKPCTCAHSVVTKYQKRISGPMLDRIDIHIEVPRVDYEKLSSDRLGKSSAAIRERVQAARERQRVRFKGSDIVCNSDMRVGEVRKFCKLDEAGDSLVRAAMSQLNLPARGIIAC